MAVHTEITGISEISTATDFDCVTLKKETT